jgi:hypothetical protein
MMNTLAEASTRQTAWRETLALAVAIIMIMAMLVIPTLLDAEGVRHESFPL